MASQLSPSITLMGALPQALAKKLGPGSGRGRQRKVQSMFPAQPADGIEQRRQMTRRFPAAASR